MKNFVFRDIMSHSDRRRCERKAFTLIELLVVIAIIALLAAILFPVFARARENARKTSCSNNLKQIGIGIMQYTQDYDECYPWDWYGHHASVDGVYNGSPFTRTSNGLGYVRIIQPYVKAQQLFQCPSSSPKGDDRLGYWANGAIFYGLGANAVSIASVPNTSKVAMLYDDIGAQNRTQMVFRPFWRSGSTNPPQLSSGPPGSGSSFDTLAGGQVRPGPHNEVINVLWADGHVKSLKNRLLKEVIMPAPEGKAEWPSPAQGGAF